MNYLDLKDIEKSGMNCHYPLSLLIGLFLLNILFLPIILATLLFVFHITVQAWLFPVSVIISAGLTYWISGKHLKQTEIALFAGGLCLLAIMLLCLHTYDFSWDGNTYHKSLAGVLKNGWNPLYETFYSYATRFEFLNNATATWYDSYPKGTELWASVVYASFGNIEFGKAFNILSIAALIFICWSFLAETKFLKKWQSFFCAVVFSVNAVVLSQSLTYYNDGFLWEMILLFVTALTYLTFYEEGRYKRICYYLIFASINMGFNVKFSSIIFFGLLGICFFGYWFVNAICREDFVICSKLVQERFLVLAGSVLMGLAFTGSTSYMINIFRHHNPLYTMIGEGKADLIKDQLPPCFRPLSNGARFLCSLFSKTSNSMAAEKIEWKFPLVFFQSEISEAQGFDTRIAGWGVFFSAIFLISIIYIIIYFVRNYKEEKRLYKVTVMLLLLTIMSIVFVPGLCWARYFIGLYYIPATAIVLLFKEINVGNKQSGKRVFLLGILSVLLFLNLIPPLTKNFDATGQYLATKKELEALKDLSDIYNVNIQTSNTKNYFPGRFFNLLDEGITNFEYGGVEFENAISIFPECKIAYSIPGGESLAEYLHHLNAEQDIVLMAVKDEASSAITTDIVASMNELGLAFDMKKAFRYAYIAVVDGTAVYEEKDSEALVYDVEMNGVKISIQSAGYTGGNIGSIKIDGVEYSRNKRGLNIVVYSKQAQRVTDRVYIDLYQDDRVRRS